jgi:hypothetical protein
LPHRARCVLVIDEDLNWKVAAELRARGFASTTSVYERGLAGRGMKDPVWLYLLSREPTARVLVTFDNKMPTVHRASILRRGSTLAIIDSKADREGLTTEEYKRDVMHRWAHRMAAQQPGTRYKYRLRGRSLIKL